LEIPENWINPYVGEKQSLDPTRFRKLLDEYYELRGWDVATGRPTRARLESLGLEHVADELERQGRMPPTA
jgi:aldehyde:ferredoxin oxidoreductase